MSGSLGRGDSVAGSVQQMLHSAMYHRDLLDAAAQRSASETTHGTASGEHLAEGGDGSPGKARQLSISVRLSPNKLWSVFPDGQALLQRPEQPAEGGQTCLGCSVTSTPEWRRGPLGTCFSVTHHKSRSTSAGPRTLCNACGLVYAKLVCVTHRLKRCCVRL